MNDLNSFYCIMCPDLIEHVSKYLNVFYYEYNTLYSKIYLTFNLLLKYGHIHGERELKARIDDLARTVSDQNLELLPEYENRIKVLKKLEYIDQNGTLQLKGHVACEAS